MQGLSENVFEIGDVDITAGFILSGLSSVFDVKTDISKDSISELKRIVNKILKGQQK